MDDLLDLSFSAPATASARGTSAPHVARGPSGAHGLGRSAFDLLAAGGAGAGTTATATYGNGNGMGGLGSAPSRSGAGTPSGGMGRTGAGGAGSPAPAGRSAGAAAAPPPSSLPTANPQSSHTDAFSSLLDFSAPRSTPNGNGPSFGSTATATAGMSLAEQAAHRARAARERDEEERARFDFAQMGFGVGAPGGGVPSSVGNGRMGANGLVAPAAGNKPAGQGPRRGVTLDDFADVWEQPAAASSSTSGAAGGPAATTRRGSPAPAPAPAPAKQPAARDPWDFDTLDAPAASRNVSGVGAGGVNLGARDGADDDDDFLGMLGKPVDHFAPAQKAPRDSGVRVRPARGHMDVDAASSLTADVPRHSFTPEPQRRGPPRRSPSPRASGSGPAPGQRAASPPPHVVGQLVEMGFGVLEARRALQATAGGVDVEAALEALLAAQGRSGRGMPEVGGLAADADEDDRRRREEERRRRRRQGPSRAAAPDRPEPTPAPAPSALPTDLTEHADRLLASASVLGRGMLSKASGLWATGKERAIKAYEEGGRPMAGAGTAATEARRGNDGRPRWMVDAMAAEEGAEGKPTRGSPRREAPAMKWDDSDDEHEPPEQAVRSAPPDERLWDDDAILGGGGAPSRPQPKQRLDVAEPPRDRPSRQATLSNGTTSGMSVKEKTAALFSEAVPAYRSAGRRAGPSGRGTPQAATPRPSTPARPPSPLRTRPHVPATPAQLARSAQHKSKGNDEFKLGKFAEAAASYTAAIDALPEGQLLRVPLHTNRATAHLKSGGHGEAIADCTVVVEVVGLAYHPAKEAPLTGELAEIKLADGLVKALNKRATGYEMAEKWERAEDDWDALIGVLGGPVGGDLGAERTMRERAMAVEGVARCRKMLDVLSGRSAKPTSKPAPAAKSSRGPSTAPTRSSTPADPNASAAVSRLREAAQAQESEDAQRLALKDSTDARLLAWSAGKETNLRGLLSSLDGVLGGDEGWKALGIKKLNIGDLITDKQVKMGYMKVIGKLHPDKLNVTTTTLEQRMIANGVFGTLNEAWHAFNK